MPRRRLRKVGRLHVTIWHWTIKWWDLRAVRRLNSNAFVERRIVVAFWGAKYCILLCTLLKYFKWGFWMLHLSSAFPTTSESAHSRGREGTQVWAVITLHAMNYVLAPVMIMKEENFSFRLVHQSLTFDAYSWRYTNRKKKSSFIFHFVFVFPSPKTVFIELRKILIKTCYQSKYWLCFNSNDFDYP